MSLGILSTVGTADRARRLIRSAELHGMKVRLEVCNMGSPHGGDIQAVYPIQWMQTMSEEYVMMVDAHDVLILANEEEILDKFRSFNSGFVMSAEAYCMTNHLDIGPKLTAMTKPGCHAYPNCGCWIGERKRAIELLQQSIDLYRYNPPYPEYALDGPGAWFTYGLLYGTMDFALDRDSVLFQSMGGSSTNSYAEVLDGRVYNTHTGTWPIAIHFHGGGKVGDVYCGWDTLLYGDRL